MPEETSRFYKHHLTTLVYITQPTEREVLQVWTVQIPMVGVGMVETTTPMFFKVMLDGINPATLAMTQDIWVISVYFPTAVLNIPMPT